MLPAMGEAGGPVTRRALLTGGAAGLVGVVLAAVAVRQGVLTGDDGTPGVLPSTAPGEVVSGTFESDARLGATCGWAIAYPPGARANQLRVLVVLHGRGGDHAGAFGDSLGLHRFLAAAVRDGVAPFAIASVDGGDTYWHRRTSGEDSGAMVTHEFLPMLRRRGLDTSRVAFTGWSMGGFGSLHLAGRLGASRVAAVAAASPALWRGATDAAPGAFDDADDFAAHTVFGRQDELTDIPLRVDCGTGDPFYPATQDYVATLTPKPAGGFQAGGHDVDYWRRLAPQQLAFVGMHLTA
jgi:enterochelin esterase-like enzyme